MSLKINDHASSVKLVIFILEKTMSYLEYSTVDNLKTYLPNTWLSDEQLGVLITRASRLLDAELWDNIGQKTITKRMDGYGKAKLVMENRVVAVDSIKYCIRKIWYPVTVDHINGVVIYLEEPLPIGEQNIEITYTKWYSSVPDDVQIFFHMYSTKLLSLDSYMAWDSNGEVINKKINGLSISYKTPSELIDQATTSWGIFEESFKNILNKYKNFTLLTS